MSFFALEPSLQEKGNDCADFKRMSSGKILPDSVKFQFLKNWKIHNFISIPKQEAQETKHMSGGGMAQAIERDWSPGMQRKAIARDVIRSTCRKHVYFFCWETIKDYWATGGGKSTTIASMFCKKVCTLLAIGNKYGILISQWAWLYQTL